MSDHWRNPKVTRERRTVPAGDGSVTAQPITEIREPTRDEQRTFTWDQLRPGHVIETGRRADVFWIMARDGGVFDVENARTHETERGTPRLGDMVRVLFRDDPGYIPHPDEAAAMRAVARLDDDDRFALAGALVQTVLRGHVMATRAVDDPDAPLIAPPAGTLLRGQLAAHLWVFHRLESDDIPDLAVPPEQEILAALHASRRAREPHLHRDATPA